MRDALAAGGRRMTGFGVVAIGLGVLAMMAPALVGGSVIFLLGGLMVVSGALRMVWAFRSGSVGAGSWMFAIGSLTLLCGGAMLANPLFGSALVTLLLTVYFLLDGVVEIVVGLGRRGRGGGWLLLSGSVSILLGLLIWAQFPLSGAWAMGILIGIKLVFVGMTMLVGGSAVRSFAAGR